MIVGITTTTIYTCSRYIYNYRNNILLQVCSISNRHPLVQTVTVNKVKYKELGLTLMLVSHDDVGGICTIRPKPGWLLPSNGSNTSPSHY